LLNETVVLHEKYLKRSRKVETEIIDNKDTDMEAKIKAHHLCAELDKTAHYLLLESPTLLATKKILQPLKKSPSDIPPPPPKQKGQEEEFYGDE
jgi:hypothetical protein